MQPVLRAVLTLAFVLAIGPAVAADAPPQSPRPVPSRADGPADNLNRYMLKILDQCTGIADPAARAECCKHLIENVCVADEAKK